MVKQAKTPRAYVNIKDLGFAVLTTDEPKEIKYDKVTQTRGLQEISLESGGEVVNAYADGGIIESGNTDGESSFNLTMHAFPKEIREIIFNEVYDENGIYEEVKGKQNNYVAVWFKRERRDGSFQRIGLPKVMFSEPNIEGSTAESDWEFSQEEVEGTAMHRVFDDTRKIIFDSEKKDDDETEFFQRLLQGAYQEAQEVSQAQTEQTSNVPTEDTPTA
ncbi:major tail protein [Staphylococcus simulans]